MKSAWFLPLLALCSGASAQELEYGEAEYLLTCAECHGGAGRGDGALARHTGIRPADLSALSDRNGGEFPYGYVYSVIDGRHDMSGQPDRAMPSFGARFSAQDEERYGPEVGSALTERRIHSLARYIATLQR